MKYYIKKKEQLKIVKHSEISFFEASRFFYNNYYDNYYIVNEDDALLDIWTAKNYISKLKQSIKKLKKSSAFEEFCSTNELNDYFLGNPDIFRKPIVHHNKLQGEYYLSGYVGNSIICKYNNFSIRWFVYFWKYIYDYLKKQKIKNILIYCEQHEKETFLKLSGDIKIEVSEQYSPDLEKNIDFIINALFDDKARQLCYGNIHGCNIYEITEAVVLKYTYTYLTDNNIQYIFTQGPDKHVLTELNDDEKEALKYQSNPIALLENKKYVKKIYKKIFTHLRVFML